MTEYSQERLSEARARVAAASAEVERQELVEALCRKEGLAYASLTEDQLGPMLVTYRHKPLGQVHTTSPSALRDWHAQAYLPDGTLGESHGPYVNARAAAASLIPGRSHPQPEPHSAG
ncbi:MAG: hypothetical protein HOV92_12660 [Streptomyces sp.]|nr:hypothetical protein [Streptomyces sp.]